MAKINLTDRGIAALKPAEPGHRYDVLDSQVPGLGVRINHKPKIKIRRTDDGPELLMPQGQFIFYAPARKGAPAVRRSLGPLIAMSLADARDEALKLTRLLAAGIDPTREAARKKQAEAELAENTFGRAMAKYLKHVDRQRRGEASRADIERDLLPFWKDRPLHEITRRDVVQRVLEIAEGRNRGRIEGKKTKRRTASPHQAYAAFGKLRSFFNWARDSGQFELETVPTDGMRPGKILPATKPRQRILSDDELLAYWRAASRTPDPLGSGYKLLLLTGARLQEVFEADRRELSKAGTLLTIPAERFKADAEHLIPLSGMAAEVISKTKRWKKCHYLFSRNGKAAATVWTKDRQRLAQRMERTLRALARSRGENPADVTLKHFVLHDVRRTVRTRLSALRVNDTVAEMIIGHGRKGIQRVYDLHKFETEMREALELWADKLQEIVAPHSSPPANVVRMRAGEVEVKNERAEPVPLDGLSAPEPNRTR